jgi:phage shock protein C
MYCANCGQEIPAASNFCQLCGARQTSASSSSAATPVYGPPRRLHRSVIDCKLGGVCGGLAEYWGVDSTIVRLVWVLLVIFPVPLVPATLGYFIAWLVIPRAEYPVTAVVAAPPANSAPVPNAASH